MSKSEEKLDLVIKAQKMRLNIIVALIIVCFLLLYVPKLTVYKCNIEVSRIRNHEQDPKTVKLRKDVALSDGDYKNIYYGCKIYGSVEAYLNN